MSTIDIITTILLWTVTAAGIVNLVLEYSRDLMMMQQNSYRRERYMRWLRTSGDTTSYVRILAYMGILALLGGHRLPVAIACVISLIPLAVNIPRLLKARYKKPLVWTPRARRIYAVMWGLTALATVAVQIFAPGAYTMAVTAMAAYALSHVVTMLAVLLLSPVEKAINRRYYREAEQILRSMEGRLTVVGITGSYGKTSTKYYLGRILAERFNVLITPGSYNTTLGVVRTVREMMKPYTEVFVCEMGAKNIGDVAEICRLVRPEMGILTAVGPQHLESFGSIENVQRAKFELVDSLPASGAAYINQDFPMIASREVTNCECHRYTADGADGADCIATDIVYTPSGTDFTVCLPGDEPSRMHTRLVGRHNISNLIPAIAVARRLGMTMEEIRVGVEQVEQVEHRLSIKTTPGGITILDDAFNSNPHGSAMALEVLAGMEGGKRIVVTPGMIELGARQEELNAEFGSRIARSADVAIVVGEYNRNAILDGIAADGTLAKESVHAVDTFADAQRLLASMLSDGDFVLYENDLPDTFK